MDYIKKYDMALFNQEGQYNRRKLIWIEREECCNCKKLIECLGLDTSDEEYSTIFLCYECLSELQKLLKKN